MAIGFPVKANYASGDILTAAQMNDLSGTLNYMDPTAKGDLFPASSGTALTRLAVGSNGETLVADSSTSTGLRYQATQAAGKNVVINGNFDIWQRGTSFTSVANGTYTADRWKTAMAATGLSCNVTQDTSVPNAGSKYSIKVLQATSATSVGEYAVISIFETSQILQLCGATTTVSFWYRSNLTGAHAARLYASPMTGGTDVAQSFTVSAANTWEKKVLTFSSFAGVTSASTAPTAEAAGLSIGFNVYGSASRTTLAANDYFQIDQVMLETGSVNTSFSRAGGTLQGELAACQRYYFRQNPTGSINVRGQGIGVGSSSARIACILPVTMRILPSAVDFSTLGINDTSTTQAVTAISIAGSSSPNIAVLDCTVASGLTQFRPYFLIDNSSFSAFLGFTAEL
jgi:hypothetical protein